MWERIPPPAELAKRPISTGLALASIAVSLAWWGGMSIDALVMTRDAISAEPWRLLTSALPHIGLLHLVFNVYWLLVIGGAIESRCGAGVTLGLVLVTSIGAAALEHAFFDGGVGLSGIGYGLFAFAWMATRQARTFEDVVDARTVRLFVVWFFICIAATVSGAMQVANLAHAGGAVIGALLGVAWARPERRAITTSIAALATIACVALASPAIRPIVNVRGVEEDLAAEAYDAVETDPGRAAGLYAQAIARDDGVANWHYNRGVALDRTGDLEGALAEYRRAHDLEPASRPYADGLAGALAARADASLETRPDDAITALRDALETAPDHALAPAWRAAVAQLEAQRDAQGSSSAAAP